MASEVDICNLALSHLGDNATLASIDPPEGSAQAEHCARFYPMARDALLEMHSWGFATKRVRLAQIGSGWPEWNYAYAQPSDALNILAILPPDSTDDYSVGFFGPNPGDYAAGIGNVPESAGGVYVPQAFSCEIDADGNSVIYTDQPNAVLRYTGTAVDTAKFSPLFTMALSWHLAALLAGPIIKGDAGAAQVKRCAEMMQAYLSRAITSDASQRRIAPVHHVSWMAGR
jgi:hypothetical protein